MTVPDLAQDDAICTSCSDWCDTNNDISKWWCERCHIIWDHRGQNGRHYTEGVCSLD